MPKKHIHKYYHADLPNGKLWACALSECNHHMPAHYEPLLNGKPSLCWECNRSFKLNPENMKNDKPICEICALGLPDDITDIPLSNIMLDRLNKTSE